jgi:hypothetical protein
MVSSRQRRPISNDAVGPACHGHGRCTVVHSCPRGSGIRGSHTKREAPE